MPVALVTGAASGIGLATALRLIQDGFRVVGWDLEAPDLDAPPGTFAGIAGDVAERADNETAVAFALDSFGSLDAVCLNAGVTGSGPIDTFPLEDFERIIAVDLKGPVLGVRAALPALRRSTGPRSIVVTASTSGLGGDPGMWAYNAAKAGAVNLVRSLAMELGPEGIRVNAVCPGPTVTAMTSRLREVAPGKAGELTAAIPLQRWAAPEEVAATIAFLVSSQASFITGVALPVDGGVTATTGQFRPAAGPR
ncbi:MAG: SDR family NAD(P)-dependent oxidoreductase [Acidimicrobiales bacterium]